MDEEQKDSLSPEQNSGEPQKEPSFIPVQRKQFKISGRWHHDRIEEFPIPIQIIYHKPVRIRPALSELKLFTVTGPAKIP